MLTALANTEKLGMRDKSYLEISHIYTAAR